MKRLILLFFALLLLSGCGYYPDRAVYTTAADATRATWHIAAIPQRSVSPEDSVLAALESALRVDPGSGMKLQVISVSRGWIVIELVAPENMARSLDFGSDGMDSEWNTACRTLSGLSRTAAKTCSDNGMDAADVYALLLNDSNHDLVLYALRNDDVIYNVKEEQSPAAETVMYVLNTNTKKIHNTWCDDADRISAEHKDYSTESLEELQAKGYTKCGSVGDWDDSRVWASKSFMPGSVGMSAASLLPDDDVPGLLPEEEIVYTDEQLLSDLPSHFISGSVFTLRSSRIDRGVLFCLCSVPDDLAALAASKDRQGKAQWSGLCDTLTALSAELQTWCNACGRSDIDVCCHVAPASAPYDVKAASFFRDLYYNAASDPPESAALDPAHYPDSVILSGVWHQAESQEDRDFTVNNVFRDGDMLIVEVVSPDSNRYYVSAIDRENVPYWTKYRADFADCSGDLAAYCSAHGRDDLHISIHVLNTVSPNSYLIATRDGEIVYDAAEGVTAP